MKKKGEKSKQAQVYEALERVKGGESKSSVSRDTGISRKTMNKHEKALEAIPSVGAPRKVPANVEEAVVNSIITFSSLNLPLGRSEVVFLFNKLSVQLDYEPPFEKNEPSRVFWKAFQERNKQFIQYRKCQKMQFYRFVQQNEDVSRHYCEMLKKVLEGVPPCLIINFDETSKESKQEEKSFVMKGQSPQKIVNDVTNAITMVIGSTAEGERTPLFLIYPKAYITKKMIDGLAKHEEEEAEHIVFSGSPTGWINKNLFYEYNKNVLVPFIKRQREKNECLNQQAIVIVDQHKSRNAYRALELVLDNNIQLIGLPPHTSHIHQPMDRKPFSVFKNHLSKNMRKSVIVNYNNFASIAFESLLNLTPEILRNSFKECGIYPFDEALIMSFTQKRSWSKNLFSYLCSL
jgi:hypothetical protein